MTDEQWQRLDEKEQVLASLKNQYKKPNYDPFELFSPTNSFLKQVIKQLKHQSYEHLKTIQVLKAAGLSIKKEEAAQKKVLSRLNHYEYRLTNGNHNPIYSITDSSIQSAKAVRIESLYDNRLRKSGHTLVGICPFHDEKTGSFTISTRTNTWRCFGCGLYGDSIDYIISRDKTDFIAAVKFLTNHL